MVLLEEQRKVPVAAAQDAQALIEQARRRARRRRLRGAVAVAVVLLVTGAVLLTGAGGGSGTVAETSTQPFVNIQAFSHEGDLAFISRERLWVLDGATGTLTPVTSPTQQPSDPEFSPNGRWLSYGVAASAAAGSSQRWLARADGTSPRRIGSGFDTSSWLPDGRLLVGGRLWRVAPSGALTPAGSTPGELVAPVPGEQRYVFFSSTLRVTAPKPSTGVARIEVSDSLSGKRTTWYRTRVSYSPRSGRQGPSLFFATALPKSEGILIGSSPFCCDVSDGIDLYLIKAAGTPPQNLGLTVGDTVSLGANGTFAFTRGGNRYAWVTKAVVTCSAATGRCTRVSTTAGTLSLDPAFSPNGRALAFVEAASMKAGTIGLPRVQRWYRTRSLWILHRGASAPTKITNTVGAAAPVWSADDRSVLYAADDALWLLPTSSGKPIRIASPLFTANVWPSFYGEIGWSGQFAWSATARS
jgi:TolB protein